MEPPVLLISWSSTRENSVSGTRTGGVTFAATDDGLSLVFLLRCREYFSAWSGRRGFDPYRSRYRDHTLVH